MINFKGQATGIGSLPYQDADIAIDLIFKYLTKIPFWPQLPKRDIREGMLAQFSQNLPCLKVGPDGLYFDGSNQEKELEIFYEQVIANNLDYFKIGPDFALGLHKFCQRLEETQLQDFEFIKCQITGPFTFAGGLSNEGGISLLHVPVFMQAILKGLALKALWQIKLLRKFGKKIILFIDEPYLACFGSAYTPLNRQDIVKGLSELSESLKSDDVLLGIHCCGNTDWSIFVDTANIDIISFDAYAFLDRLLLYADNLKKFFQRGGILCWGIVPTQDFTDKETPDLLAKQIQNGIDSFLKKGLQKDLLLSNLLISPACGLGTLDAEKAKAILRVLSEISNKLFDKLA